MPILGIIDAEIVRWSLVIIRRSSRKRRFSKPQLEHPPANRQALRVFPAFADEFRRILSRASSISRWIADTLSDEFYFAAASTLSDYEALSALPRHIQKIFTLCLLYRIASSNCCALLDSPLGWRGASRSRTYSSPDSCPAEITAVPPAGQNGVQRTGGFVAALVSQWEEIPLFLRFSLDQITGLKGFSLSDVFWWAAIRLSGIRCSPMLIRCRNRRARKPSPDARSGPASAALPDSQTGWQLLCGRCTLNEGNLVLHGYPGGSASNHTSEMRRR